MSSKILSQATYSKNPFNKKEIVLCLYAPDSDTRDYVWSKKGSKVLYYYNIYRILNDCIEGKVTRAAYWGLLALHADMGFYDESILPLMKSRYDIFSLDFTGFYERQKAILKAKYKIHPVDEKLWDLAWHGFFLSDRIAGSRNEEFDLRKDIEEYDLGLKQNAEIAGNPNWIELTESILFNIKQKEK